MPQLDSLRPIAVAPVIWHHWASRYQFGFDWGRLGVTLFFVLSGFLITGILIDGRDRGIATARMHGMFYLGSISYGLYMFNNFAGFVVYDLLHFPRLPIFSQLPLFAATTIALAVMSWHFFEKPINDRTRHFPYPLPSLLAR